MEKIMGIDRRSWTDQDLVRAIDVSTSWRGVLRELGLKSTSSSGYEVARRHARRLGLDTTHINGNIKYSWPISRLNEALSSRDWAVVAEKLGFEDTAKFRSQVRGYARRVGVEFEHLDDPSRKGGSEIEVEPVNVAASLRAAAPTIATAWFLLHGYEVATPQEPTHYDLLVTLPDKIARVQVKSTAYRPRGRWVAGIGRRPYSLDKTAGKAPYDPDLLDYFFVVDGDGNLYMIPGIVVAGMTARTLSAYEAYIVGSASTLLNSEAA